MLAAAGPAAAALSVGRTTFATGVVAREPVGAADRFPPDVGEIYFYTHVLGADVPTDILHVWIYDGEEKAIVPLTVGSPSWRTWSSKRILPGWRGDWTVEVRDLEGNVLATGTCRIE